MFRPCVSGLLAKHLDGRGCRQGVWNPNCAASILWSGQSAALPKEAPGTRGKRIISCAYAVRGCSDPVAGACCRSHLQNYHGITLFRAYKSPEGRGEGKGGMGQPVQGPWHGNKGMLGGTPTPAGS